MTTRLPPKNPGLNQSSGSQSQQRVRRGIRPQAAEKPKPIKAGGGSSGGESLNSPEAALWGGQDIDKSLEIRAAEIEAKMGELATADLAEKEEGAEHLGELHDHAEKQEKANNPLGRFSWKQGLANKQQPPPNPLLQKQQAQQQQTAKLPAFRTPTGANPALKPTGTSQPNLTGVSSSRLSAVASVQKTLLSGTSATHERPPDAFALLKEAKDKGILFVEDALAEGHSEDQEDPELRSAVEECIRLCFGLRGILRIGPGHNDKAEPIIVVATTHGFSDASLAQVPEKVHRFATLIAIPFDLLPLKRER